MNIKFQYALVLLVIVVIVRAAILGQFEYVNRTLVDPPPPGPYEMTKSEINRSLEKAKEIHRQNVENIKAQINESRGLSLENFLLLIEILLMIYLTYLTQSKVHLYTYLVFLSFMGVVTIYAFGISNIISFVIIPNMIYLLIFKRNLFLKAAPDVVYFKSYFWPNCSSYELLKLHGVTALL
ncbi:hypothetical protein N7931_02030 [Catenovulum sp. 2E275]|uniref:hypothetical protein n=1 Tax=Catenovulum sp. 2E275 TaxID=2980497 RepID=UPI0021D1AFEA|nr:hypothetical protein [Catenovulum sp. 2E275]MCU4674398.1 hypothetical protein [Catenovulum sp. 2E275]